MDDTETSPSKFPIIAPILLSPLVPIFRFLHMFRVSDIILEELGFEFIPDNRIGLSPVDDSDLGLFELRILGQPGVECGT